MKVRGKVWVVTGGGSGIGRELAVQLLEAGASVAAVDVRPDGLERTADLVGRNPRLSLHVADITDRSAVAALAEAVLDAHGAVDGVINNAGIIQPFIAIKDLDYDTINRLLDVNLMGTIHMVKAFLPLLLQRDEAHIANVSSMGAYFPFPGQSMYGASKAAVALFTEALYSELLDTGVRVSLVYPGAVSTAIAQNSGVSINAAGSPKMAQTSASTAARTIIDGIERDRLFIYIGRLAKAMNLAMKVAPVPAIKAVRRRLQGFLGQRDSTTAGSSAE